MEIVALLLIYYTIKMLVNQKRFLQVIQSFKDGYIFIESPERHFLVAKSFRKHLYETIKIHHDEILRIFCSFN